MDYSSDDVKTMYNDVFIKHVSNKTGSYLEIVFYNIGIEKSGDYTCDAEGKKVSKKLRVRGKNNNNKKNTVMKTSTGDGGFDMTNIAIISYLSV